MRILLLSLLLLFVISCASNVRNASVPTFGYVESDFTFGAPNDITISLKPNQKGDKWVLASGGEVPVGSDLQTILEVVYPDGDAFKYGKVVNQKNLKSIPLGPMPMVLKNETDIAIRALQVGKHK
jgi:hypothetical protein|tara:strand:- start:1635 stop:2009 length:375 start_codon:yes stop_codon:yes gene_type:complete